MFRITKIPFHLQFRRFLSMEVTRNLAPDFNVRIKYPEQNDVKYIDQNITPVVLIFGWAGSQDKHLMKYSQVYEDLGLVVASCRVPLNYLMWKNANIDELSEGLMKCLIDEHLDERPFFVHLMSNGGAAMYYRYINTSRKFSKDTLCKGMIFDSSPAAPRISGVYGVISALIAGPAIINVPLSLLATTSFKIYNTIYELINRKRSNDLASIYSRLLADPNQCPQHFIYSKADKLTLYEDVERFIELRRQKGIAVSSLRYEDSDHVQHLTKNKTLYIESITQFLRSCFDSKLTNVKLISKM